MKIKRICILILIIIIFSNNVFAMNNIEKQKDKIIENYFKEWIEKYKGEDIPENERILDYFLSGYGIQKETDEILYIAITFSVTPFSDNTIWTHKDREYLYLELNKNDNYSINYISRAPKNLEKFLNKYEEYKENNKLVQNEIETQVVKGEQEKSLVNQEVKEMSNVIFIVCFVFFIILLMIIFINFLKKKKKY